MTFLGFFLYIQQIFDDLFLVIYTYIHVFPAFAVITENKTEPGIREVTPGQLFIASYQWLDRATGHYPNTLPNAPYGHDDEDKKIQEMIRNDV